MSQWSAITVFASSSDAIRPSFAEMAQEIGRIFAHERIEMVYGGGNVGLMGHIARSMHESGGRVVGVIPEALMAIEGRAFDLTDDMFVTPNMSERKRILFERGEGFLTLPGGYGTLEEFLEVVTLRQLGYHDKPIVLFNPDGFYNSLVTFMSELEEQGLTRDPSHPLFRVVSDTGDILEAFDLQKG